MSSYGSNKSGYLHPQHHQQQPPYPTTPGESSQPQQSPFYPSQPQTAIYGSSPPRPQGAMSMIPQQPPRDRRSSSTSSQHRPSFTHHHRQQKPLPTSLPIRQPSPSAFAPPAPYAQPTYTPHHHQPIYARTVSHASHASHHSTHMHDPHAYADGEDKYEAQGQGQGQSQTWGPLDEDTEREYEARYRRERVAERRPTLGGSVMSMVGKLGRVLGSERH